MTNSFLLALMALSATGTCLVPMFGLLCRLQPQFMHGLSNRTSRAEVNCYIVGALYAGVFFTCLLSSRNCWGKKQETALSTGLKRNKRYKLPFVELESKEFVRAMEIMDRNDDRRARAFHGVSLRRL
ncbi:unnamed protein product [Hyaloperonospora brassicae]|uniref:RxLR effector candidate protein n=1 Tax=Hyaloperonospora brassicae TaxID=162125 RepID=A0AAV0TRJ2_HYABA|nr:unnamed protein product [Hyaloperonospora brassicae]